MRVAITGHRPNKLWNDYTLTSPQMILIKHKLQELIDKLKPTQMVTGMALGIDTLWAKLAIENNIPFIAAIPCINQSDKWPISSRNEYLKLICDPLCTQEYISLEPYTNYCMSTRNQWMVNNSDVLIAVWDGTKGGTSMCYLYSVAKNRKRITINPHTLETKSYMISL